MFGKEFSSCQVSLDKTKVQASVSCSVAEPRVTRTNEAILSVFVYLSPMTAPKFEVGPGDRGGSGDQPDQKIRIASNETEAKAIAKEFPCSEYVIKAMVLAGGRGKGRFNNGFKGGVYLTKDPYDIATSCTFMIVIGNK